MQKLGIPSFFPFSLRRVRVFIHPPLSFFALAALVGDVGDPGVRVLAMILVEIT